MLSITAAGPDGGVAFMTTDQNINVLENLFVNDGYEFFRTVEYDTMKEERYTMIVFKVLFIGGQRIPKREIRDLRSCGLLSISITPYSGNPQEEPVVIRKSMYDKQNMEAMTWIRDQINKIGDHDLLKIAIDNLIDAADTCGPINKAILAAMDSALVNLKNIRVTL